MNVMHWMVGMILAAAVVMSPPVRAEDKEYAFHVTPEQIEDSVAAALISLGVVTHARVTLSSTERTQAYASDRPVELEIKGLKADQDQHRFSASLLFKAEGQVLSAVPVTGRFESMERLPVLKRVIRSGEQITAEDIAWQEIPSLRMREEIIRDAQQLIGKSPLRTVSAMRPVRSNELGALPVLKKNALVQMHYQSGALEIATSGVAMEDGAVGQSIRVRNPVSSVIVQAMVEDAQRVRVIPLTQSSQAISARQVAYAH